VKALRQGTPPMTNKQSGEKKSKKRSAKTFISRYSEGDITNIMTKKKVGEKDISTKTSKKKIRKIKY
jgi:hypothetical protein